MEVLSNNEFATPAQLATLCGVQLPAISKATQQLAQQSLIVIESDFRPTILRLSFTGARSMDKTLTSSKRPPSASVQQHACHRNEIARVLLKKYAGFAWTPKRQLLKHGLRPALGEHGGIDGAGRAILVLLDDYTMASHRILRTWTRRHVPDMNYYHDSTGARWCERANGFVVATTREKQAQRHRRWVANYNHACKDNTLKLPDIEVLVVNPLWGPK
jgi:hypothetical protein